MELEKVKAARIERERERQERLELEELEQRYLNNKFNISKLGLAIRQIFGPDSDSYKNPPKNS